MESEAVASTAEADGQTLHDEAEKNSSQFAERHEIPDSASDGTNGLQSSQDVPHPSKSLPDLLKEQESQRQTPSSSSIVPFSHFQSMQRRTPPIVNSNTTTPQGSRSLMNAHFRHRGLAMDGSSRSGSRAGSVKRTVQTPAREVDDSEDELA